MATPYIMPLGFIARTTDDGAVMLLTNPEDSRNLLAGTPVTVWRFLPEHLALGRTRGKITQVGYTTARFGPQETQTDPRWPGEAKVIFPSAPVFLALENSFDPDPSKMLTQDQADRFRDLAAVYAELTRPAKHRQLNRGQESEKPKSSRRNGSSS